MAPRCSAAGVRSSRGVTVVLTPRLIIQVRSDINDVGRAVPARPCSSLVLHGLAMAVVYLRVYVTAAERCGDCRSGSHLRSREA